MNQVTLIVVIVSFIAGSNQQNCDQAGLRRFDELTSMIWTAGNANMKFPENPEQLQNWCKQTAKYINENEEFNRKCNKNLFRQAYTIYTYAFRRTLVNYCNPVTKLSTLFLNSSNCFNQNKNKELICFTKFQDQILGAQNEQDESKKIPHLCCSFNKFMNCFFEKMTKLSSCDEDKITVMTDLIKSFSSNTLELLCGDYRDDSDKCDTLGEPPKKKKSQRRSKSLALPSVALLSSFKEISTSN